MIEFSGQISGQTLNYILNQERKRGLIAACIVSVLAAIAIVVVAVIYDTVYLIGLAFPVIFVVISVIAKPGKSTYHQRVYIEGDMLVSENAEFSFSRKLDQVETVIDFGEGYHIIFYSAYRCPKFICQKSLLTKGTIEEFEKLFSDKIIR